MSYIVKTASNAANVQALLERYRDWDLVGYSIAKDGTVYRTRTKHKDIFRKIQTKMKPNGYLYCTLSRSGLHKNFYIHRLVAQAFIPNPENKPHIDHINGDKKDNRVENLRWVTHKENMNNPVSKAILCTEKVLFE